MIIISILALMTLIGIELQLRSMHKINKEILELLKDKSNNNDY